MILIPDMAHVREADAYTIQHEPVTSEKLMERAANAIFQRIFPKLQPGQEVVVFAGMGNNGGDGLVIARLLAEQGVKVSVYIPELSETGSTDFQLNFERLNALQLQLVKELVSETDLPAQLPHNCIVIDALFGSGLNREPSGFAAQVVQYINRSERVVVAVDVPSGLFADKATGPGSRSVVRADYTFSFEWPKLAFFCAENEVFVGRWELVPIGLHPAMHQAEKQNFFLTEREDVRAILHGRSRFSHKGTFGHALLIAGEAGKTGAAILAAKASMRAGLGLLHVHLPRKAALPLQCSLPEAMLSFDANADYLTALPENLNYSAIAIGPGIGREAATAATLKLLIQEAKTPLLLDADALNILSENPGWLAFLPPNSILTPHLREFERLTGKTDNHFDRLQKQREFAMRFGIIVVLKGAYSSVGLPDGKVFFNPTGNAGMATAGSGDVLTGIILSLLAQNYRPAEAALLGVYLHGLAGDIALEQQSEESLLASDIVANLGKAFASLRAS